MEFRNLGKTGLRVSENCFPPISVSLAGGFVQVFAEELQKVDFPLAISAVRRADDAITSVSRGCLIAAAIALVVTDGDTAAAIAAPASSQLP